MISPYARLVSFRRPERRAPVWRALLAIALAVMLCGCSDDEKPAADGKISSKRDGRSADDGRSGDGRGGGVDGRAGREAGTADTSTSSGGWLHTSGNRILLPNGKRWRGRGANIHDTRSCNACTWYPPDVDEVKRRVDELVDTWKATYVRLLLESYASAGGRRHYKGVLDDPTYLKHIKAIVDHITVTKGVYVLMSLWIDPSFSSLGWPTAATQKVWQKLAATFKDNSHVMFGLVNEPESNFDGSRDAACWKAMNDAVAAIRQVEQKLGGKPHIIAVQGTGGWARRLDYYMTHPITAGGGKNIVYEVHVYNPAKDFAKMVTKPAAKLPVVIGEFGPYGSGSSAMTQADCTKLMDLAEANDIPHLAWTFHMRCPPNLLVDNTTSGDGCGRKMKLTPTSWGKLLVARLAKPWK